MESEEQFACRVPDRSSGSCLFVYTPFPTPVLKFVKVHGGLLTPGSSATGSVPGMEGPPASVEGRERIRCVVTLWWWWWGVVHAFRIPRVIRRH